MPTYINPRRVDVEPRSRFPIAAILGLAVIGYATYQVGTWLASMMAAILAATAVVTAAAGTTLVVVLRRQHGRTHLDAPQWVTERLGAPRIQSHRAVSAPRAAAIPARSRPAIEAPSVVHYHLHVEGVPDELARVLRRVRPAIEEDQ